MKTDKKRLLLFLFLVAISAFVPLFVKGDYILNVLFLLFLYIIMSQGSNIMVGYAGLLNVGQAAFFGIGALAARLAWIGGTPFYLALLAGGLSSVALSVFIGFPSLRLRGHYFAIGTLALAIIARITIGNILPGVSFVPNKIIEGYSLVFRYYLALGLCAIVIVVVDRIFNSRLGLAILSTRDDEEAAQAIGINIFKYKMTAFALSSFVVGLAGGLFAFFYISYYYYVPFGLLWSFEPILITFVGGAGTIAGPVLGSIFFVLLKEAFAHTLGEISILIFGIVLIVVILFLPGGLVSLPKKVRSREAKPVLQKEAEGG
ncbi:MAG: branched-chain amino acid ABC transporter permease [Deltaproteobacteria bacterium]|nr:branched-chain amino acid ABC transporter permease [Deltaproteobacteria bacterium]